MANQTDAIVPSASLVGNSFVSKYYNVLHTEPQLVHCFYTDVSSLTRAEAGPEAHTETVHSLADIRSKIMSLDIGDCKAEIKTVDSQASLDGSVLVAVTGAIYKTTVKSNFMQTFLLAPQEKGFYVRNDIFRYLDHEWLQSTRTVPLSSSNDDVSEAAETITNHPSGLEEQHETEDHSLPSPQSEEEATVVKEEAYRASDEVPHVEEEVVEVASVDNYACDVPPPIELESVAPEVVQLSREEEMPTEKKSYASILRVASANGGSPPAKVAMVSTWDDPAAIVEQQSPAHHETCSAAQPMLPATAEVNLPDKSNAPEQSNDWRSVYIKNLPMNILATELEKEFSGFGAIRPNGVQVRSYKLGGCYGFVEFEDPSSARSAIEASPILIANRPAYVEEKRSTSVATVTVGRGRPLQGRGGARGGRGFYGSGNGRGWTSSARGGYRTSPNDGGYRNYNGNGNRNGNGTSVPRSPSTKVY